MKLILPILASLIMLCTNVVIAQDNTPFKYGDVTATDFSYSKFPVDTSSGAIILSDVGSSNFEGNSKGWFSLIYKVHRRVKVFNQKGHDLANVSIPLYRSSIDNMEETLEKIKGVTYNFENGQVVETKLDADAIFKEKISDNRVIKKFTMPSIKDGCIFEYTYTIKSDYIFNLQPWTFQGQYPRIWSEYTVGIPGFFAYATISQGFHPFHIAKQSESYKNFSVVVNNSSAYSAPETYNISSSISERRWVMRNVPALNEEKYTSSIDNYISKIEFQMSGQQFPNSPYRDIMGNWLTVAKALMEDERFGYKLQKDNDWMNSELKTVVTSKEPMEKAQQIFKYMQSRYKSQGNRGIYLSKTIKDIAKAKTGYISDLNLLLTAMLIHEGIDAQPALLSTKGNGFAHPIYPILDRYNYVVSVVVINKQQFLLDCSVAELPFGQLPLYCYNGSARVIGSEPIPISLSSDSLIEFKSVTIDLKANKGALGWKGTVSTVLGEYESTEKKTYISENGIAKFKKSISDEYTDDYSIDSVVVEGVNVAYEPVSYTGYLTIQPTDGSKLIYFNPNIKGGFKDNPFVSEERKYPVEMPYKMRNVFELTIDIPEGYEVDEMPKNVKVKYDEGDIIFTYQIIKEGNKLIYNSSLNFDRATFAAEEYPDLRSFFDYVVNKYAEQIVFKKKS
ncbi:MAG: DUF3858 domain-containing protein [Ferruginibacter sp.]